jgi:hypothetical protein
MIQECIEYILRGEGVLVRTALTVVPLLLALGACGRQDSTPQVAQFCATLERVNSGSLNTEGLAELEGHALVVWTLLEASPPSLRDDLSRIHDTVDAWARAVSGEHPMIDTFEQLSSSRLIGSEGRVTDYIALHCGIDLGGPEWVESGRPTAEGLCPGWPRVGTPLSFNHFPNLPDTAGSNYFSNNFLISKWAYRLGIDSLKGAFVVEPGSRVVMRGQYPATRYFAYHPNDMDLNNLATLRDRDLNPDPGSVNPFREEVAQAGGNYYTATLVFGPAPAVRAPNTSYVGRRKDGERDNRFVMNLLRMYHIDAGNGPGSGGVPLPAVSIYDAEGDLVREFGECDLFAPDNPEIRTNRVFPAMPVIDHRPRNPPRWTTSSNFGASSDTLANADVQYLATHYSKRFGELFVVRARYLSAPDTRGGESPATSGTQVRLYNLCTYNFWNGGATHCILENELRRDESGFYTLVLSKAADRPGNLAQTAATWLDWGPYLDGQLQYRYVYRENRYVAAIAAAAEGRPIPEDLRAYVPVAVPCDTATYETGGWRACFSKANESPH